MRRAVRAACSPTCKAQDIRRVRPYMASATDEQKKMLLPMVYANLDPARIPDEDTMDSDGPLPEVEDLMARAQLCLELLYAIEFSNEIGPDIWPRVWPWVQFLDSHQDRVSGISRKAGSDFYVDFLMFAGTFADHSETHALITTTPGVYFMVGKAWPGVFDIDDTDKREIALNDLRSFLANRNIVTRDTLSDLTDGAGGTLQQLASLVVFHIAYFAPSPDDALDLMPTYFLSGILEFLAMIDPNLGDAEGMVNPPSPFAAFLLSHNVIEALTTAACALSISSGPLVSRSLRDTLTALIVLLGTHPGYGRISQALEHHLLRALVNCAHVPHGQTIALIDGFLIGLLPPALVYYRVMSALIPALHNVIDLVKSQTFESSPVYEHWNTFNSLAMERIQVFNSYNNNENPLMKACDNLECDEIGCKNKFKRCSGCKSLYYCSPECQALDWNAGGHRNACRLYGTLYLSAVNGLRLKWRDRGFLRAIVHKDYLESAPNLATQKLVHMHDFPGQTFLTVYDYSQGRGKISVQHLTNMKDYLHGPEWDAIVARAAASRGRMWVDVVMMPGTEDPETRCGVIPLRTSTSTVYDGLQRLASELTGDSETWDWDRLVEELVPLILTDELAIH
ncbi:hypothetical protein K438DRAFT_1937989 [Mycena galopus ATCC 62051]|nr:hypothetical protein K438DRAFT_1937989 [Mycena galopus ATCC 62051]